jgi:hypothetical protein
LDILKGRYHSENLGIDGRIILKWILEKSDGKVWTGFVWSKTGSSGGSCEHINEPSGYIKGGAFLD